MYCGAAAIMSHVTSTSGTCHSMITFTPLAGGAQSSQTTPLCYLLQVDDVRILLDCGSPDWNLESFVKNGEEDIAEQPWEQYAQALERYF